MCRGGCSLVDMKTWHWGDDTGILREALDGGGVIAIPSESSYGLAVDPRDAAGVEAVYAIKEREAGKPLPVIAADLEQLFALGVPRSAPEVAVARRLWPAPLTLLWPVAAPLAAMAGAPTLAARVPAHDPLRLLMKRLGHALTATSANLSGQDPVRDPGRLEPLLAGHRAIVIDDGMLLGGPPSTLAAWPDGELRVLRAGAYPAESLPPRLP